MESISNTSAVGKKKKSDVRLFRVSYLDERILLTAKEGA